MQKLAFDYYDASDGPRVVLFGPLDAPYDALQSLFKRLAQTDEPIEFHNQPFIEAADGIQFYASRCKKSSTSPGVTLNSNRGKKVQWKLTTEDWEDVSALTASLIRSPTSWHQYLSRHPHDDAIIVISNGEYDHGGI